MSVQREVLDGLVGTVLLQMNLDGSGKHQSPTSITNLHLAILGYFYNQKRVGQNGWNNFSRKDPRYLSKKEP